MLRRIALILVVLPVSLGLIALAVANRQAVPLVLDPFAGSAEAFALHVPLFVVVFAALIIGVLLGGVAVWLRQGRFRRAARIAHREARRATAQAEELRSVVNANAGRHLALTSGGAPANTPALPDRRSAA